MKSTSTHQANFILKIITLLVYFIMWAPVIVIIVLSFSSNKFGIKWEHFTLKWYFEMFKNPAVTDALLRSIVIALITVIVSTIVGTLAAYGLYKFKFKGKQFLRTSILLPIVLPEVVIGAALLVFFTRFLQIPLGVVGITVAHIVFSTPLAVFIILGRMQRMDWAWEEAAMDLGANRFRTFMRVTGPILMPGIAAAAALIFPWSFDDFVITYFVSGVGSTTLPVYVFSQMRYGTTPMINTIGTLFVVITLIPLLTTHFLAKKGSSLNSRFK